MARRKRHSLSGSVYHVMMRGNNGQSIFSSDFERCQFCLLMQEGVERYGHQILAFCLMTNHVHLAIQVGEVPLSKICQNLSFRYSRFYNWRHNTIGHLFQGRFRSILVDGNSYLRKLIRYIHLNPIRSGLTDNLQDYLWSSHQAYLKKRAFTWLASDAGLLVFDDACQEGIEKYHEFVLSGIGQIDDVDFKKGIKEGIVADDTFIEGFQQEWDNKTHTDKPIVSNLATLLAVVATWYKIDVEAFSSLGKDRRSSQIRAVTAHLARGIDGITLRELADFCGRADNSMSQAANRLEIQIRKSQVLKSEVDELKAALVFAVKIPL